jgi:hypothetical protein
MNVSSSATAFSAMAGFALAMGASSLTMMLATAEALALAAAAAAFAACLFCFFFSLAAALESGQRSFPCPAITSRWSSRTLTTSWLSAVSSVLFDSFASLFSRPVQAGKVVFLILTTSA